MAELPKELMELVEIRRSACTPTPAVVVALGRLGAEVAADVEGIFLRGDERRAAVTCFLTLADGPEGPSFLLLKDTPPAGADCGQTRREVCEGFVASTPHLRTTLEAALRELHTHERLIEAGLGEVLAPPVDLIVVADLTEPGAAGTLVPLALLLQDLLAYEPYGMGHLLLSVGARQVGVGARQGGVKVPKQTQSVSALPRPYPAGAREGELAEAQVYATLQELDTLADPQRAAVARPLAEALGLEEDRPLSLCIYLFDHRKEGTREVKDRAELRVILGNFLLALLSGGLAQRLGDTLPGPERLERRAFYSSAAATALIFEPEPLIEACAGRLGAEFVAAEMGPDAIPAPRLASELAVEMAEQLGSLRSWLERLCADTPCEVRATDEVPTESIQGLHLGLHFARFRFERIRKEDWAEAIASYDALFGRVKLPRYRETMEENAAILTQELLARQDETIEKLPQSGQLYPGGPRTVRRALRQLDERLEDRIEALSTGAQSVPLREEDDLQELEAAAWNFPDLPAFVARLVLLCTVEAYTLIALGQGLASRWTMSRWLGWIAALLVCAATVGAGLLWLRRKDQRLIALRDRCVRNSEQKYAVLLEEAAREQLIGLCGQLRKQIAKALERIEHLKTILEEAQEQLAGGGPAPPARDFPPSRGLGLRPEAQPEGTGFRVSAVDDAFADWVFRRWRESLEEMRDPLLEEHRFLDGWREATAKVLAGRLLDYGRQVFAPVWELRLEDVLRQRGDGDTEELLLALAREAVPLLRPNFDRLGGGSHAHASHYVLVGNPGTSAFAPVLDGALAEWEVVTTGDPYVAACCRVRHLIPLAALRDLTWRGRRAYEALEPEERLGLHVVEIGD